MSNEMNHLSYEFLIPTLSNAYVDGQQKTISAINAGLVHTYWQIGQHIVEFEQQGHTTAEYGAQLLKRMSKDLKLKHGKGFSVSNLQRFRQFN